MSVNNSLRYYWLARRAMRSAEDALLRYRELPFGTWVPQDEDNLTKLNTGSVVFDECCICEVFSALYVEAQINQFGELALGKKYYYDHMDKLDPKSKIILLFKMIDQVDIDKSDNYYADLVHLYKTRNDIVHHKSQPNEKHVLDPEVPYNSAKRCFQAALSTGKRIRERKTLPYILGPSDLNTNFDARQLSNYL